MVDAVRAAPRRVACSRPPRRCCGRGGRWPVLIGRARPVTATPSRTVRPSPTPTAPTRPGGAGRRASWRRLTDADLVGQVLMPSINLSDPRRRRPQLVTQYRLGGVILMGNIENTAAGGTAAQVRALTDALQAAADAARRARRSDLLVGTDQEYGWVTRIKSGMVQLPSAMAFGAAGRPDLTEAAWRGAGAELAAVGINVDFAPDADVLGSPANYVIGSRSYGSDPAVVSAQVAAAVRGLQSAGVAATIKHFPGHGHTTVNSHEALPVLSQSRASAGPRRPAAVPGRHRRRHLGGHVRPPRRAGASTPACRRASPSKVLVDLLRRRDGLQGRGGHRRAEHGAGPSAGPRARRRCGPCSPATTCCSCRPTWPRPSRDCSTRSPAAAAPGTAGRGGHPGAHAEVPPGRRSPARPVHRGRARAPRRGRAPWPRPRSPSSRGPCYRPAGRAGRSGSPPRRRAGRSRPTGSPTR